MPLRHVAEGRSGPVRCFTDDFIFNNGETPFRHVVVGESEDFFDRSINDDTGFGLHESLP